MNGVCGTARPNVTRASGSALTFGECGLAVVEALRDFLDGIRSRRHVVFELDRRRERVLLLLHQLKDLLQRRVARAPRQVAGAVRRGLPILQVHARDPVVELPQKWDRALAVPAT